MDRPTEPPHEESGLQEEMGSLGFYSGDRVKLRTVELTPEVIGGLIRRKVDMTMDALTKAWNRRPRGDQDTEDQLLDILAKTQKLQREVKDTFSAEKMKELDIALKKAQKQHPAIKPKKDAPKRKLGPKKKPKPAAHQPKVKKPARVPQSKRPRRK